MAAAAQQIITMPGETLSPSSCSAYLGCSCKWYFRYVEHLPDPPTGALAQGSAVHYAVAAYMAEKAESHQELPTAGVLAVYHEAWSLKVQGGLPNHYGKEELPVEFRDDEDPAALEKEGAALTAKYIEEAAPSIEPAYVEFSVAGRIGDVLVKGFVDLMDVDGRIIDLKTAARKPSSISSDYRFQIATYTQLTPGASGKARVDTLTKTKVPALYQDEITIDQADIKATETLYPAVQESIRKQVFLPNRSSHMCSRKYCAFWRACEKEFGGKVLE